MRVVFDIEANGLLDNSTIDYTQVPYKLKDSFTIHCLVVKDIDTGEIYSFVQDEVVEKFPEFATSITTLVGHNSINYDNLVLKLYLGMDYEIGPDTFMGRPVIIEDTMVLSKTLNADRLHGHSLDSFGKRLGFEKINWRQQAIELGLITIHDPKGAEFLVYHPKMLEYCIRDVEVTEKTYELLMREWGTWDFSSAYELEKKVAEIITRQEHRGFWFDRKLAEDNLIELDALMLETKLKVEPYIPPKKPTKATEKLYTPPKNQFIKSGQLSSHMKKFVERLKGEVTYMDEMPVEFTWKDTTYPLPLTAGEALIKEVKAGISDSTHIKEWLVRQGWNPSEFSEKDLTVNTKKVKHTREKYNEIAKKYIEQTLNSPFIKDRCDWLKVIGTTLEYKLLNHDLSKPLKVLVNPKFTVGTEKEICPNLFKLGETFPYATDLARYYTYNHRRNSILGGGLSAEESGGADKGYLAYLRADGRIPTPADTCGCNTTRMKHRICANIPRITSLYGDKMRALFGADSNMLMIGSDGDSLEAKIEAHYTYKYDGGIAYGEKLVAKKPNDFHTKFAAELTEIVGQPVSRGEAKGGVKYGLTYGSRPPRLAKSTGWSLPIANKVFDLFWERASPLKDLKTKLEKYWETTGKKQFILGLDGRKIYTRSKHSLLNTLFQSAGLICMKRSMIIYHKELDALGLLVDFFMDDWTNSEYYQQMIHYHDEADGELSRSLVKFKKFDSEADADDFTDDKMWSDIIHKDDKYYRAYSIVGEIIAESLTKASEYYKLNVELTAGYMVGRNWKECH